jgi:hypothetical protein
MKVVDPQSALITNIEVYDFLRSQTPRKETKKIGAYETIDLKGYREVRQDVSGQNIGGDQCSQGLTIFLL